MKISVSVGLSTTLTTISNSSNSDSEENLANYISEQLLLNGNDTSVKCKVVSRDLGELIFRIYIDKYCIDSSDFTCTITAVSEIEDLNNTVNDVWDNLEDDVRFNKELADHIKTFVESLNNVNIYVPKKESFRFENGRYFIEIDPICPYTPEFEKFNIENYFDEDTIAENIVVR